MKYISKFIFIIILCIIVNDASAQPLKKFQRKFDRIPTYYGISSRVLNIQDKCHKRIRNNNVKNYIINYEEYEILLYNCMDDLLK